MITTGNSWHDLESSSAREELLLDLLPVYDAFQDLFGGVVILRKANILEFAGQKYGLTPWEREVFEKLVRGYENSQISDELSISPCTVKIHVHHIYEKTGASTRIELYWRLIKSFTLV